MLDYDIRAHMHGSFCQQFVSYLFENANFSKSEKEVWKNENFF